jgi:ATP diphosphatase
MQNKYQLTDLIYLMQRLRQPDTGCPWDIKQTFSSIVPHTIEEAYEVADAINQKDWPHLEEELGDLLFQVIFYSQLGDEEGHFDLASIIHQLVEKLIRRHPHVFPNRDLHQQRDPETCLSDEEIKAQWQQIKQEEKALKVLRESKREKANSSVIGAMPMIDYLADIPSMLPALSQANKIQKAVSQRGFDWQEIQGVIAKVREELVEVEEEISAADERRIRHEVGDLLFAVVNLARHLNTDPEVALKQANQRFSERYTLAAQALAEKGRSLELKNTNQVSEGEMETAWLHAKKLHPQLQAQLASAANDAD